MGISLAFLLLTLLTAASLSNAMAGRTVVTAPLQLPDGPLPALHPAVPPNTAGPLATLTSSQLTSCMAVDATIHEAHGPVQQLPRA